MQPSVASIFLVLYFSCHELFKALTDLVSARTISMCQQCIIYCPVTILTLWCVGVSLRLQFWLILTVRQILDSLFPPPLAIQVLERAMAAVGGEGARIDNIKSYAGYSEIVMPAKTARGTVWVKKVDDEGDSEDLEKLPSNCPYILEAIEVSLTLSAHDLSSSSKRLRLPLHLLPHCCHCYYLMTVTAQLVCHTHLTSRSLTCHVSQTASFLSMVAQRHAVNSCSGRTASIYLVSSIGC
jgi:hypothetical protein